MELVLERPKDRKINLKLVVSFLKDTYFNDRNNAIIDSYIKYRYDDIQLASSLNNGLYYVLKLNDSLYVAKNNDELFEYALKDREWLDMVAVECKYEILDWWVD